MIYKMLTIITCLFDLGRRCKENRRDINFYLENSKILDLNYNIVIFCDPELEEKLWKKRDSKNTKIISIQLEDVPEYNKFTPKLIDNHKNNKILDSDNIKDTPIYMFIMLSKYYFVNEAIQQNPFSSDIFAW